MLVRYTLAFIILLSINVNSIAQNVGIGTTIPKARLHVTDSSVLFSADGVIPGGIPTPPPAEGIGRRMMWYPQKAAFRAGLVSGNNWDKDSIGSISFATGANTKASGLVSFAAGQQTSATGLYSTSFGYNSLASGLYATATGISTIASGLSSIAFGNTNIASGDQSASFGTLTKSTGNNSLSAGLFTIAKGESSMAIGSFTKAVSPNSLVLGQYNDTTNSNRLFEIGNGTADNARSNALTVLNNGTVGIGTTSPLAGLHVEQKSVLFKAPYPNFTSYGDIPYNGGVQSAMVWYADKAAFLTGASWNNEWNKDSVGFFSVSGGLNCVAPEFCSIAFGQRARAYGFNSVALGLGPMAMANGSIAMGENSTSTQDYAIAIGRSSSASNYSSVALGEKNSASGAFSIATGLLTKVYGETSFVTGNTTFAKATGSFTSGNFNDSSDIPNPSVPASSDRIFQVANGSSNAARSNALTILRNGNIGLGNVNIPDAPISFSNSLGRKITFYGNGTASQYGMGIQGGLFQIYSDAIAADIAFGYGSSASFTEKMRIKGSGAVGIGTTTPSKQLEVIGPGDGTPVTLRIGNRSGFGPTALEFISDYGAANQWRTGYIKTNDIGTYTGSLEFFTNGSGVGSLNGSVKGFEVRNGAALTATGAVGSFSDIRLKNSITPFTDGLDVIRKLNPVTYYYNADAPFPTDKKQVGIIAQELEAVAPYMVEKNKEKGYDDLRLVNNQAYTFLLINAVKQQQEEIDELKKLVKQLLEVQRVQQVQEVPKGQKIP